MRKVVQAWTETNKRADGKKFYTAFIRFKGKILWFIPIYYTYPIVQTWSETQSSPAQYWWSEHEWHDKAHKFGTKERAEQVLLEIIDKHLDEVQAKLDSKVVEKERDSVEFQYDV